MRLVSCLFCVSLLAGCGSDNSATLPEKIAPRPKMTVDGGGGGANAAKGTTTTGKRKPPPSEKFVP